MSNKKPSSRAGSEMKSQLKEGLGVGVSVIITVWTLVWRGNWGVWSSPTHSTLVISSTLLMLKCQETQMWTHFYDCIFKTWSRFNPHLIAFSVVVFFILTLLSVDVDPPGPRNELRRQNWSIWQNHIWITWVGSVHYQIEWQSLSSSFSSTDLSMFHTHYGYCMNM